MHITLIVANNSVVEFAELPLSLVFVNVCAVIAVGVTARVAVGLAIRVIISRRIFNFPVTLG